MIQTFNFTGTIVTPVTHRNGSNVVVVYDGAAKTNPALIPNNRIISANSFIKNFRGIATIRSLPEVRLPDFRLTDSDTDKLYKSLDLEWKSPRKQLDLLIKNGMSDWQRVFSISLLNPSGYPFRVYSLTDGYTNDSVIELGSDGQIGVRMQEVSHGLIEPNDELVLHGSWVQEIVVDTPDIPPNIIVNVGAGAVPTPTPEPTPKPTPEPTPEPESSNLISNAFLANNNSFIGN